MSDQAFNQLCEHFRTTAQLRTTMEVLEWDERTKLPPQAGDYRAEQVALLSGMIHARDTDPRIGDWLEQLGDDGADDPHGDRAATIRELRSDYEKSCKLPQSLVEELKRASVLGQQAWVSARKNDDYAAFEPQLAKIIQLLRSKADAVGYDDTPYDALLDDYEPRARTADVRAALTGLRQELTPLVASIRDCGRTAPVRLVQQPFEPGAQERLGTQAAERIGFDFQRGRLDDTAHPFCTTLGPHDHRITTRYDENFFNCAFFGILHEAGHGIYEQGLRPEQFGLPPGHYASLGIHESQSRLWENLVGRSRAFWQHFFPEAQAAFPAALADASLDDFHFAVNDVRPSLIRVEADEATYNLHIVIRFELEQALIAGDLSTADLPAAWDDKYREYLGIEPPNHADGVLQDVHWSAALMGYFPTYSLGNLYASQLFEAAERELGDLHAQFAAGDFQTLRDWLTRNVYHAGRTRDAADLVRHVTGESAGHDALMRHLRGKFEPLYGI